MDDNKKKKGKKEKGNSIIILILIILIIVIIGLISAIIVLRSGDRPRVTIPEKMEGWNGSISESTKIYMFDEDVSEKMMNDDSYSYEDAVSDYEYALNHSDGERKVYVAVSYANFVFYQNGDMGKAIKILDSVSEVANKDDGLKDLLNQTYYDIYSVIGDEEKMDYYKVDNVSSGVIIMDDGVIVLPSEEDENNE